MWTRTGTTTLALTIAMACGIASGDAIAQASPKLQRVLHRWIDRYEKNAIDLDDLAVRRGVIDPLYGRGWLGPGSMDSTHRAALVLLLDRAGQSPSVPVAEEVLRLASIGLADGRATLQTPHFVVRAVARRALTKFTSTDCIHYLMRIADGDFSVMKDPRDDHAGLRTASILALGSMRRAVIRPTLQRLLQSEDVLVRLASAEALRSVPHPGVIASLARAMRRETDPRVGQALVRSIAQAAGQPKPSVAYEPGLLSEVVESAVTLLGRTDWRADLEVVEFLAKLRSVATIEPLIEVLERAAAAPGPRYPRRLLLACGETLRSLTGARITEDKVSEWRAYWTREESGFALAPPKKPASTTRSAGFFGLPVEGSNVVFVIDTSGSMRAGFFPSGKYVPDAADDALTRLIAAKRELRKVVKGLPAESRFNLVSFATAVRPWRKNPVPATRKTRLEFAAAVDQLVAKGGTNVFGALEAALGIETLTYGSRYESTVDEVFLLSDGEPTAGKLVDPVTILQLIRQTNRFSRVRIHTVFMGAGGDSEFMRELAAQNGGRYVRL